MGWITRAVIITSNEVKCPLLWEFWIYNFSRGSLERVFVVSKFVNRSRTALRFTRFVCPALRFIPHEPRKKDTHSLKLTCHINRRHICFSIKSISVHSLLWMNVMLDFICMVVAELWSTGSNRKIQNHKVCLRRESNQRPLAFQRVPLTMPSGQLTTCCSNFYCTYLRYDTARTLCGVQGIL